MSWLKCHDCEDLINTDDPESCEWIEIGNMRRQTEEVCICQHCYEERCEKQDWDAQKECQAMDEAEKADGNSTD